MTLRSFIEQTTSVRVAESLGVTTQTVYLWRTERAVPRPLDAYKLIQLSLGALTFDQIYTPWTKRKLKGKRLKIRNRDGRQLEFKL